MTTFSIVTVVRNDPAGVVRTLQSVFAQSFPDYEIIVQDGASTDETSGLLRALEPWIDKLAIEPDGGIYDAMNRALDRAEGDWLLFLNAADFFVHEDVLARVAKRIDPARDDIFVGQAIAEETREVHPYRDPDQFWAGSTCDHQASFIRRDLMQRLGYRTEFRIAGDLDFFTRARAEGARFRHERLAVACKPFSVGASVGFADRVEDRLAMLEAAFGDRYPVRAQITQEMRDHTARHYELDPALLADMTAEEILATRRLWEARLGR